MHTIGKIDQFRYPGDEYSERWIYDCDPNNERLQSHQRTFGRHAVHRGVYMEVRGCTTQDEADDLLTEHMLNRGWTFRERWWQFWRCPDPRNV